MMSNAQTTANQGTTFFAIQRNKNHPIENTNLGWNLNYLKPLHEHIDCRETNLSQRNRSKFIKILETF